MRPLKKSKILKIYFDFYCHQTTLSLSVSHLCWYGVLLLMPPPPPARIDGKLAREGRNEASSKARQQQRMRKTQSQY
jgi:hypothetical protein